MKKFFTFVITIMATLLVVACGNTKTTDTKTKAKTETTATTEAKVKEVSETYKMTQNMEGGSQDIFIDLTYSGNDYKSLAIRYESHFTGDVLAALQAQGRETVEANFRDNLGELVPGVSAIKEMKGVEVTSAVDENYVWKLTVKLDPNVVDFEELASKGDSFAFLADVKHTKPSQLIAGFSIVGFKKVTE